MTNCEGLQGKFLEEVIFEQIWRAVVSLSRQERAVRQKTQMWKHKDEKGQGKSSKMIEEMTGGYKIYSDI